jgi:TRAP-type mannitol/chloroaromatic compound transport system substrate-binding protein
MKGKRLISMNRWILMLVFLLFLPLVCAPPSFAQKKTEGIQPQKTSVEPTYKWRCQAFTSAADAYMTVESLQKIMAASGGRIQIKFYSGGEIAPANELLKACGSGMLDMARGYGGYWPAEVDIGNIETGLPMTWRNLGDAYDVLYSRGLIKIIREAYMEKNVYWWPAFGSLYNPISKKPINSLKDMQGMKLRVAGPTGILLKNVGVATAFLPF